MRLSEELEKYAEQLYTKTVPQNVRDFIEMTTSKKPSKKVKETILSDNEICAEP